MSQRLFCINCLFVVKISKAIAKRSMLYEFYAKLAKLTLAVGTTEWE